jgi:hypothetical protein
MPRPAAELDFGRWLGGQACLTFQSMSNGGLR